MKNGSGKKLKSSEKGPQKGTPKTGDPPPAENFEAKTQIFQNIARHRGESTIFDPDGGSD